MTFRRRLLRSLGLTPFTAILAVLCAVATASGASPRPAAKPLDPQAQLCARPIAWAERKHRIPEQLLAAVAVAESARWRGKDRAAFAWPWTVTSGPETWHFDTRQDAVAHVRALKANGVGNIDVGCMQVNLGYHGHAFASIEQAIDPDANVAYAARFLAKLHAERRSWAQAVGFYHSATPTLQNRYRRKVFAAWGRERRRVAEERRLALVERYEQERQARQARQAAQAARQARQSTRTASR